MPEHFVNLTGLLASIAAAIWVLGTLIFIALGKMCNHSMAKLLFGTPCLLMIVASYTGYSGNLLLGPSLDYFSFGNCPWLFRLDSLSCTFIAILCALSVVISFFSPGYLNQLNSRINSGHYWAALTVFILSMVSLVASANAISFLVFWELMSLSSLALVASEHDKHEVQRSAHIYLAATRIATALISVGFVWMHSLSNSWDLASFKLDQPAYFPPGLILLLGFCIKAGIWPFHIWLPYAHPVAPAPVSALLSGVMIKIPAYAIIRIFIQNNAYADTFSYLLFVLGLISSFWGVLFALVQHDLKRLLAYSSVENIGLIFLSLGLCMLSRQHSISGLANVALAAAISHCLCHAIFKSLLFLGAGSLDSTLHTRDLHRLGGISKKMPVTSLCFFIGSASVCALPPLNGFFSKWLIYQSLFKACWLSNSLLDKALFISSLGTLAMVGALSLACFSKAYGISFLANPRDTAVFNHAKEVTFGMRTCQIVLASCCLIIGLGAQPLSCLVHSIANFILTNKATVGAKIFTVPIATYFIVISGIAFLSFFFLRSNKLSKKYSTWECGFGKTSSRAESTALSFAQPIARIFSPILRFKLIVEITGKDKRHFPEHVKVDPELSSLLENSIYMPAIKLLQNLSKLLNKLQAGSIHLYLLYVCFTLVILLLIGVNL